jgi:hydrogenase maturation protease
MVAGLGNVFMGDDGFGCEVVARLVAAPPRAGVRIEDYGIRGMHLALDLLDGYDLLILVDALAGDEPPGTVRLVEPNLDATPTPLANGAHDVGPEATLQMLASMGGRVDRVVVVGCQPADVSPGMGLSGPVRAAVEPAVRAIESLLEAE